MRDEEKAMLAQPSKYQVFTKETPSLPMHYPSSIFRTLCNSRYEPEALLEGTGLVTERFSDLIFDPRTLCYERDRTDG